VHDPKVETKGLKLYMRVNNNMNIRMLSSIALAFGLTLTMASQVAAQTNPQFRAIDLGVVDPNLSDQIPGNWELKGINKSNTILANYNSGNGNVGVYSFEPQYTNGKVSGYSLAISRVSGKLVGSFKGISNRNTAGVWYIALNDGYRWDSSGGLTFMGTLLNWGQSNAYGVNSSGTIAGASTYQQMYAGAPHGVRATPGANPPITDLTPSGLGLFGNIAFVINDGGTIAGFTTGPGTSLNQLLLWRPGQPMLNLGQGNPWGINADGDICGRTPNVPTAAVYWRSVAGTPTSTILVNQGVAFGIRDRMGATNPTVVGGGDFSGQQRAFWWGGSGNAVDLNTYVTVVPPSLAGAVVTWATDISSDPNNIVVIGYAVVGNKSHMVALVPVL
jgi:hypothetical protein